MADDPQVIRDFQFIDHTNPVNSTIFIELDDDSDEDCIFLRENTPLSRGTHNNSPICVDGYVRTPKSEVNYEVSVQCVDDDEIRVLSTRSSNRKQPIICPSIIEIGESSGSKSTLNDEIEVIEIPPDPKPVLVMFICEICADSKPRDESFKIKGCYHSYCFDCMKTYVASKLQDGVSHINCPVPECVGLLEPEYCRDILPFEVFDRWGTLLCESVILASQKFYCPFKDCSALLIDDDGHNANGAELITQSECPICFRLFCAQCKVGWHHGIACAEFQTLNKDEREKEDIMLKNLAKGMKWQRCPACKFYVEKAHGCNYVKCRCGVAFCYTCGSIHTDHTYHYCKQCGR